MMKDFEKCILGDGKASRGIINSRGKKAREGVSCAAFHDVLMVTKTLNFSLKLKILLNSNRYFQGQGLPCPEILVHTSPF